jgi:hypothetical protein
MIDTETEAFEESMNLIDKISESCEGAEYYNMLFALAAVTAMLLTEIRTDMDRDARPLFFKMLKDHLQDRPDIEKLH